MRLLVTGASGFIGSNLLSQIHKHITNFEIAYAVARKIPTMNTPSVEWIEADLQSPDWVKKLPVEQVDTVIHLAQSKHYRDFPEHTMDIFNINVRSTMELAEWSLSRGVSRFVFSSTGNVYGVKEQPSKINDPCNPETMYAASKLSAETLLKPFSAFMDIQILRLFGVYGPGQKNAMIPNIIETFLRGEEITLASNVGVKFNPIYIDDCISIVCKLINEKVSRKLHVSNIGGTEIITLHQIISMLETYTNKKARKKITDSHPNILLGTIDQDAIYHVDLCEFKNGFKKTFDSIAKLNHDKKLL